MNITGIIRIYKKEFEGKTMYSTTVSKKDQFGNYENMYISVQLPKDVNLENNSKIEVTNGFLSFYKTNQGMPKIKVVVLEFKNTEEQPAPKQTAPSNYEQQAMEYYDNQASYYGSNELPF